MGSVIGRKGNIVLAIEADAISVSEVGILSLLASIRGKPDGARLFVETRDLHDGSFALRNLVLQPAGDEIVQVEMAPVVPLRVPDEFVRGPEHAPRRA